MNKELKLYLLKSNERPQVGELACNVYGAFNIPFNEEDVMKSSVWFGNVKVYPFLILDFDKIVKGETFVIKAGMENNKVLTCSDFDENNQIVYYSLDGQTQGIHKDRCGKILGTYTNLYQIIEGKISDGDTIVTFKN